MRRSLPFAAALLLWVSTGVADTRRTTAAVTLRARPGEAQAAVTAVAVDTEVEVLEEQGRWVRVKALVNGKARTGWVARTLLTTPAPPPATPPPPPPPSEWTTPARPGPAATAPPAVTSRVARREPPPGLPRLALRAEAGLGYRSLDMRFTSNGGGGLAGYLISADAAVAGLDVAAVARPRRWLVLVVEGGVRTGYSSPGLDYMGPTLPPGDISFRTVEASGRVGAGLQRGAFEVAARGGLHYDAFLPDEVANVARLPRERLAGLTAGAAAEVSPRGSRVRASVAFDLLVAGGRRQTPGLEDGQDSDASALWASAAIRVGLAPRWWAVGSLWFTRATTSWSGPSVRQPDSTAAARTDQSEIVQLGVGAEL